MKKIFYIILSVVLFVTISFSSEILKLSEIKVGMEGIGRTIFKGTEVETFQFKILGVLKNIFPNKSLIIVELKSPVLKEGGIISGMSGSPVYINGKLIGAVAYGINNFSKRPIGGVTPIEDILNTSEYNNRTFSVDISNIEIKFDKQYVKKIVNLVQRELMNRVYFTPDNLLSPIKLISSTRGFNPNVLSFLSPLFTSVNSLKFNDKIRKDTISKELFKISSADAASILLIRGDFEYAASGTVTLVDGKKIYLFGHPFFNLGSVQYPIHKSEIISIVPSYQSSFKLTASKNMIGTVVQDRFSALQGEIGKHPYMIPLKVFLKNRNSKFNIEMANHPLLTPALSLVSLLNIFYSEYQQYGFQSLSVRGKIFIENEKNVIIDDLFSGTESIEELSNLVLAINFFLMNNREKRIKIQKIDFEINGSETIRRTDIENAVLNKNSFLPGEIIDVSLYLKNERGTSFVEKTRVKAPTLKPGSVFYLLIADKREIVKFDTKNIRTSYFPNTLTALIRAINNIRKNNRVYFKVLTATKGLFIKGYEYSNLPLSLRNVFVFNSSSGFQSDIKYSTIAEYQLEIPAVVRGRKFFKLMIKER